MGEIATWSAVKTKVGLGRDGNDCPTKAELLALSPTGTGEDYIGLELSNASSYGDNETVQIEDVHKVTYKYNIHVINPTLNFPAIGGVATPAFFTVSSNKQKYLDGVKSGSPIGVNHTYSLPSWVSQRDEGYYATENLELTGRSDTVTFIQDESGKTATGTFVQAAATQNWEYRFDSNLSELSFTKMGGTFSIRVSSYKQEYRNGHTYGSTININYTRGNSGDVDGTGNNIHMSENKSTSARYGTVTYTQAETGKTLTISCTQEAGVITYGDISITSNPKVSDIPASGGTISYYSTLPGYSQTWGWNGNDMGGGTITSGGTISYGSAVSVGSLGTTAKSRTQVGSLSGTISLNGKSVSVPSVAVYQQANQVERVTNGTPVISLSAGKYTFSNRGDSTSIYASVSIPTTNHWTSGATSTGSSRSDTPSLSISGSGFSLSGTTVSASENTGSARSCTVTASYSGATSKSITIEQGAVDITYNYYFEIYDNSILSTFPALGATYELPITSYKKKVVNGTETSDNYPVPINTTNLPSWLSIPTPTYSSYGYYVIRATASENTSESSRSHTFTVVQTESGRQLNVVAQQNAGVVTYNYVFSIG